MVRLAQKLEHLRYVEGTQRGFGRSLTKAEVHRLMRQELGAEQSISPAYLSQLETGARGHMTERTRSSLAAFYKVHPGYLVSDPEGFETELLSGVGDRDAAGGDRLTGWLGDQVDPWRDDPLVLHFLLKLRRQPHPRQTLEALDALLELAPERLTELARSTSASEEVEKVG